MVKIKSFSCYMPIKPNENVIPQINQLNYDSDNLRPISEEKSLLLQYNKGYLDPKEVFTKILHPDSSLKYERLSRYWPQFLTLGMFKKSKERSFYVYRIQYESNGNLISQIGLMALVHLDSPILGHENTLDEKVVSQFYRMEEYRTSISPVYLMYKDNEEVTKILEKITHSFPIVDFFASTSVRHTLWKIQSKELADKLKILFKNVQTLFIADGHHRVVSSKYLRGFFQNKNKEHTGKENYNYILSSIFPVSQLQVLEYNRIVKNVSGFKSDFLPKLKKYFRVEQIPQFSKPDQPGKMTMYRKNRWYSIQIKSDLKKENNQKDKLDTFRLQLYVFEKIFGIADVRNSKRIFYVAGNKPSTQIQNTADMYNGVAFILYPMDIKDIITISENFDVVPPKSTWFEPKLLKGLMFWKIS